MHVRILSILIIYLLCIGVVQAQECSNPPVKIANTSSYYSSIQNAYDAAVDDSTIEIQALNFIENIDANRNISVTFQGGYNCDYTESTGMSVIEGSLSVSAGFLSTGSITVSTLSPDTSITAPASGAVLSGVSYSITGTANQGTYDLQSVQVSTDGGTSWNNVTGTSIWSYLWTLPLEDYGSHIILARAIDMNNVEDATPASVNIFIDTVSPSGLTNLFPLDASIDQSVTTNIVASAATDGSAMVEYFFEVAGDIGFTTGLQQSGWQMRMASPEASSRRCIKNWH